MGIGVIVMSEEMEAVVGLICAVVEFDIRRR